MTPDTRRIFTVAEVERLERENASIRDELARIRRLFNRLEAAVSHHKKALSQGPYDQDVALWRARDKILDDYATSKG